MRTNMRNAIALNENDRRRFVQQFRQFTEDVVRINDDSASNVSRISLSSKESLFVLRTVAQ